MYQPCQMSDVPTLSDCEMSGLSAFQMSVSKSGLAVATRSSSLATVLYAVLLPPSRANWPAELTGATALDGCHPARAAAVSNTGLSVACLQPQFGHNIRSQAGPDQHPIR